jgi:plasmid stabilization system protein ParE
MPLMYEACRDPYLKSLGYRKAIINNYIMVYKVDEERETVYIMRFFHGKQDYEKLI